MSYTHTAEVTCGKCGETCGIALGMASAIYCGGCEERIVMGEPDPEELEMVPLTKEKAEAIAAMLQTEQPDWDCRVKPGDEPGTYIVEAYDIDGAFVVSCVGAPGNPGELRLIEGGETS